MTQFATKINLIHDTVQKTKEVETIMNSAVRAISFKIIVFFRAVLVVVQKQLQT